MEPIGHRVEYEVYQELRQVRQDLQEWKADEVDVRLVVYADHAWCLESGDVCYDVAHGIYCAAGTLTSDTTDRDLQTLAVDLVDEIEDQASQPC